MVGDSGGSYRASRVAWACGPKEGGAGARPARSQGRRGRVRPGRGLRRKTPPGPHLSARQGGGSRCGLATGPLVGCRKMGRTRAITSWATALTKASWARSKEGKKKGRKRKPFAIFKRAHQHLNSNANLNSNKQKQCNSMCATVNSYSSLI
jgi:hypothetical protein